MQRQPINVLVSISFALLCTVFFSLSIQGAEQSFRSYCSPDGTHYFALGLRAPEQSAEPSATGSLEVVFLVDTSAGQLGQARLDTLSAIVSAVNKLPDGTKIQIFAMDVNTEPLTEQFAVKGSPEIEAALKSLHRRVPLGAADFGKGLETARKSFENGQKNTKRAVLYLGGGRSMAKTITSQVFEKETKAFTEQKIPFTACAVGLRTNFGFISAFANSTGGNLIDTAPREPKIEALDEKRIHLGIEEVNWDQVGKRLADSATASVVWVDSDSVKFPEGWIVYPAKIQPIRSDRATILLGQTSEKTLPALELSISGQSPEKPVSFTQTLHPAKEDSENNYLKAVIETAAKDGGAVMPLVGWDSLLQIQDQFIVDIENQIDKADAAASTGNLPQAIALLDRVLQTDPNNKVAQTMFNDFAERMNGILPNVMEESTPNNESVNDNKAADNNISAPETVNPPFVDAVMQQQSVSLDKLKKEVESALNDAQKRISSTEPDFDVASQNLRIMQHTVKNNTALIPSQRDALVNLLGNMLSQVENSQNIWEFRMVQQGANEAKKNSQKEMLGAMQERREKSVQIFDRFTALMNAAEYEPAWSVAEEAVEVLPNHTAPYVARRLAQMITYIDEYEKLRHQRHVGFIESFMEAERSFIPIPDEPPFTYIDKDRWKLLSDYRKEKYSAIALSDPDESVKTIKSILECRDVRLLIDETTTFADLFRIIKDELRRLKLPDIHIDLDRRALEEAGEIRSDTTVAPEGFEHPRMRLRSTLNRLLSPHDLTYIIRDESLLITTVEESRRRENMINKVYPIGDIYMLDMNAQGGGGGMMGGGMMGGGMMGGGMMGGGMMGGGMMGGGMMGGGMMGGGMMGGGMMGGGMSGGYGGGMSGGGYYSLPDEITRETVAQKTAAPVAAKTETSGAITVQTTKLLREAAAAEDCQLFWTNYFAQENIDPLVIHQAVQRLSKSMRAEISEKEPSAEKSGADTKPHATSAEQIVALVESAILSGNAQPWMYEALSLSLYIKGAPQEEVLRAALSAADFCEDPMDLFNIGYVMRTMLDLKQYAFPLYQQALENMPPKREFYAAAFRLAEELYDEVNDEESIRWISLAILSQEWDGAIGKQLKDNAENSLIMLNNRFVKRGENEASQKLTEEISEAKLRDCIVTVEWTGNAGLDMIVREPSSSVCWFKEPRSISGGLLKPTPVSESGKIGTQSAVKKISYVCPKGFNGTYTLALHKTWGTLPNNLVKVTVETNAAPGEPKTEGTAIPMDADGAVVNFVVETGRRTETINESEQEMADVAMTATQNSVNRNKLIQQLIDDAVLTQTTDNNGNNSNNGNDNSNDNNSTGLNDFTLSDYLFGSRYVGYQPVVQMLSVGSSLNFAPGTGFAVSPDRRYVLMQVNQQYNTLRSVSEYSTSGGSGNNTTGNYGNTGNNNNMMGGGGMMNSGGYGGMNSGGMMGGGYGSGY